MAESGVLFIWFGAAIVVIIIFSKVYWRKYDTEVELDLHPKRWGL